MAGASCAGESTGRFAVALTSSIAPQGKVAARLVSGSNMVLDFRNKHEIWMYFDQFAPHLSGVLNRVLRSGDIFVDCGANVGYFSFLAAGDRTKNVRVLAIDPNPYCSGRLQETKDYGGYGSVTVLPVAVGNRVGSIPFNIAVDPMYSSISDLGQTGFTETAETIQVSMRPLDDVLDEHLSAARVRLLKIDVEGAELATLRGAERSLKATRFDYIYIEVHPIQLGTRGETPEQVYAALRDSGYEMLESLGPVDSSVWCPRRKVTTSSAS